MTRFAAPPVSGSGDIVNLNGADLGMIYSGNDNVINNDTRTYRRGAEARPIWRYN